MPYVQYRRKTRNKALAKVINQNLAKLYHRADLSIAIYRSRSFGSFSNFFNVSVYLKRGANDVKAALITIRIKPSIIKGRWNSTNITIYALSSYPTHQSLKRTPLRYFKEVFVKLWIEVRMVLF